MKTLFTLDFTQKTITASKTTLNKASKLGTPEYKELMKILAKHPTFEVAEKVINIKANKNVHKGLTYDVMEAHLESIKDEAKKVVPEATEIRVPSLWVKSVVEHDYDSEAVAFAQVLKVFLWIAQNEYEVVTNDMIAEDLGCSVSTVVSAKNVLEREYENITKRKISEKIGEDKFRTLGQELAAGAWWKAL